MISPSKVKQSDKENEFKGSPKKYPTKVALFNFTLELIPQQQSKKEKLSDIKSIVLEGLKPMDVNTSFDEEVPENEGLAVDNPENVLSSLPF